ncbi:hypothetical protein Tco_0794449 [Tanacetum coccineum]
MNLDQSTIVEPVPMAIVVNAPIVSTNMSVSTTIAQDAPSTSHSLSSSQVHPPVFPQVFLQQSTSWIVSLAEPNQGYSTTRSSQKMEPKNHPLDNIRWQLPTQYSLKWIYKVKLDEYGDVLKNKAGLDVKGYLHERTLQCTLTDNADADHAGKLSNSRISTSGSAQFLGDRLESLHQRSKEARPYTQATEAEYLAMSGSVSNHFDEISAKRLRLSVQIRFLCTGIDKKYML